MKIKIRKVEIKDREIIESIVRKNVNFIEEEKCCAVELLDIYLKNTLNGDYLFLCAADEIIDKPIGYLCYGRVPFTDAVYDLYWIVVDPLLHGKGIGKMLVSYLDDTLKEKHARMLFAETSSQPKYDKTRIFYGKIGFNEVSRIRDFYRVGDDKVIYMKQFGGN